MLRAALCSVVIAGLLGGCSLFETGPAPGSPPRPADPPVTEPPDVSDRQTYDNRPACRAFVAHVNKLECVSDTIALDEALVCADGQQGVVCDAKAFWDCARDATRCESGRLVRSGIDRCPPPCGAQVVLDEPG